MTPASLQTYTQKDLAQMARQGGVRGWHSMRKDQLIRALLNAARSSSGQTPDHQKNSGTGPPFRTEQVGRADRHRAANDRACPGGSRCRQSH